MTQLARALTFDCAFLQSDPCPVDQRHAIISRRGLDDLLRFIAEAALRRIHNPLERQIVIGRGHDAEIGHRIADFEPFIKARTADDAIGQTDRQETVLEGAHLVGRTHENSHVVEIEAAHATGAALHRLDFLTNPACFFLAIPMTDQTDLFTVLLFGPEFLAKPALIAPDDTGGGREDMRSGSVVLFQPDHMSTGKILFEPKDIAHFGPAPAIDRLVVVADAADVLVTLSKQAQPEILGDVGVLIFIDQDVFEPALVLLKNILMRLENCHHMQKKIAEIDSVQLFQAGLVLVVQLGAAMVIMARIRGRHLVRRQGAVLPVVDERGEHAGGPTLVIDIGGGNQLFQQADLIVGIKDGEVGLEADKFRVAAQQLDADCVEGAKPRHAFDRLAEHLADPVPHLARCLVGEGHGENFVRTRGAGIQQMHDPGRKRTGFAGARPGQHQHGPVEGLHRLALRRVQPVEIGCRPRSHGAGGERGGLKGVRIIETAHTF